MYNIYIKEKKQKQENDQKKEELRKFNYAQRYKRDQSSMLFNYNARVKDFILDMATSDYSLPHKNVSKPILNTRLQYIEETKHKIKGRRGILFFSYKSEKDRINEAIEYNKILSGSVPLELPISQSPNQSNRKKCSQPQMRFKPKSNIERIREAVNLNYFGKVESEIINGQLSSIRDKVRRRMFSSENSSLYLNSGVNNSDNDNNHNNIEDENAFVIRPNIKKKIPQLKYILMPIRRTIKDYDYISKHNTLRTHFKGVEVVALNETSLCNSSQNKTKTQLRIRLDSNNLTLANPVFDFEEKAKNNILPFEHYSLLRNGSNTNINLGFDRFIKHKNPNNRRDISVNNIPDLNLLKQIAFVTDNSHKKCSIFNELIKGKLVSPEDIKMHEDKITIGNETFGIQSDINRIAGKVLCKCNVYNKKNKNNSTKLEAKKGKLMATHGLSIKDFLSKYNLPG